MSGRDAIKSLDTRQQCRDKISVWFGSRENYQHGLKEVIANSSDEISNNFDSGVITITLSEDRQTISVADSGRGVRLGDETEGVPNYVLLFETLFTGTNYDNNENGKETTGTNGCGTCVLNHTSTLFEVESSYEGKHYSISYSDGANKRGELEIRDCPADEHGTTVTFTLDKEVYIKTDYNIGEIKTICESFTACNDKITIRLITANETIHYHYEGVESYFDSKVTNCSCDKIVASSKVFVEEVGGVEEKTTINFTMATVSGEPVQESYLNNTFLKDGGAIVDGIVEGVRQFVNKHAKDSNLYQKNEKELTLKDVASAISFVCSVLSTKVEYANQTKFSTSKKLYKDLSKRYVLEMLEIFKIENPNEFDRLVGQVLINMRARAKSSKMMENVKKKLQEELTILTKPKGLLDCKCKDPNENRIFISEGRSALSGLAQARNPETDALFAIRGKILNCLKAEYKTIFDNEVVLSIMRLLGCGIEVKDKNNKEFSSFDEKKLNYGEIILAVDADPDGKNIRALLLTMFYRLTPTLIAQGRVKFVLAPLFEIEIDDKVYFATSEDEKNQILAKHKGKSVEINRCKGLGENSVEASAQTLMNPNYKGLHTVTMNDVEEAVNHFELFMGTSVAPRKEFIGDNFDMPINDTYEDSVEVKSLLVDDCMEYSTYTITDRALPSIDGFKPSQRRILYSMYKKGLLHNKKRTKSANVSGDVMRLHPHGTTYPTTARMARRDTLNAPLIDGKGSFGMHSCMLIEPASERYCVTGDTLLTTDRGLIAIEDIVLHSKENSDNDVDINVCSFDSKNNKATKLFNCGKHPVKTLTTELGYSLRGTGNHPVLTLCSDEGLYYEWKTLDTIKEGDYVVLSHNDYKCNDDMATIAEAQLLGGMVSEGYVSSTTVDNPYYRIGFGNTNKQFSTDMSNRLREIFNIEVDKISYVKNALQNGDYYEFYLHSKEITQIFKERYTFSFGSSNKQIPKIILQSSKKIHSEFLRYLFEGDGGVCISRSKHDSHIHYSSASRVLIQQVQTMLLTSFGILSGIGRDRDNWKLKIQDRDSILLFKEQVGFAYVDKNSKLSELTKVKQGNSKYSKTCKGRYIPYVTEYINKVKTHNKQQICRLRSLSSKERLIQNSSLLKESLTPAHYEIVASFMNNDYKFLKVASVTQEGEEVVYSPRVESECHSYIANGIVSHNTEVRLSPITQAVFNNINKNVVDMADNYDNSQKEPIVLPVEIPFILVNPTIGIAVGFSSNICGYNLAEVCRNTAKVMVGEPSEVLAPDFGTGAFIVNDTKTFEEIHRTGKGTIRQRAKYRVEGNSIIVTEIPYLSTVESIIDKVVELVKNGVARQIIDINNYSGIKGLDITIDLKKGADPQAIMNTLYRETPLENTFSCNFTMLVNNKPVTLGAQAIMEEWCKFRVNTARRQLQYDLGKIEADLELLQGLSAIVNCTYQAISIIESCESDAQVVPELMKAFGINKTQATYIADMKLRKLNKESITKKIKAIAPLQQEKANLDYLLNNNSIIRGMLAEQLESLGRQYGEERRSTLIEMSEVAVTKGEDIPDHNVRLFGTKEGYFKKIPLTSIKSNGVNRLKDEDDFIFEMDCKNSGELLVFTDKGNCYKAKLYEIEDKKMSELGMYLPTALDMNKDESIVGYSATVDFKGSVLIFYSDNRVSRIKMKSYATVTKRKSLANSLYLGGSVMRIDTLDYKEERQYKLITQKGREKILDTSSLGEKTTRDTQGVLMHSSKVDFVISIQLIN